MPAAAAISIRNEAGELVSDGESNDQDDDLRYTLRLLDEIGSRWLPSGLVAAPDTADSSARAPKRGLIGNND